ncbi:MAG: serine/threonine-protein phosphatase [Eubacterium sp.]|nr:serine/threonine-protein phosphatase [Eubacterium sp.]
MKVKTAVISRCGGRKQNDDTVKVCRRGEDCCVFVGDGLGGYRDGWAASLAAAEAIEDFYQRNSLLSEERMEQAAKNARIAVERQQSAQVSNMKTTLTVLAVEGEQARWMHIGDTRVYYFKNGTLMEQTMDHSVSQLAVLMGEITPDEIRNHEDRNRVLRALGSDNSKPDISSRIKLEGKEAFLLCTDGFWEHVLENEMEQTLQEAMEAEASPECWLLAMEKILKTRVSKEHDNYSAAAVFCQRGQYAGRRD